MAATEEEEKKPFTVQDRRRFSAEGETKLDVPEDKPFEKPTAEQPRIVQPGSSGAATTGPEGEPSAPSMGQQARASAAYEKASAGPQNEITFASFLLGLSTEALALLGEMPHPATGERIQDLVGAQQIIDVISVLRDKTRGNLSHDEDSLMDAILFDLRMKYVEKARQTPR